MCYISINKSNIIALRLSKNKTKYIAVKFLTYLFFFRIACGVYAAGFATVVSGLRGMSMTIFN